MKKTLIGLTTTLFATLLATVCVGSGPTADSVAQPSLAMQSGNILVPDSSLVRPGVIHTHILVAVPNGFGPLATGSPTGMSPSQLRSAYGLGSATGGGAIAIVDAFNYPTALNDFNFFSNQFGLPTEPSTDVLSSSNTVLQVVYASGKQPRNNSGWALEMSLDIEWAHAMAPGAKIYLVEAASNSTTNLMKAESVAKGLLGVKEVSNSWGGGESASLYTNFDNTFTQSGVVFFASGGDTGGSKEWPALSSNVVAVGGTTLNMSGNTYLGETVWSGTGCGISSFEPRPAFQDVVLSLVGSFRGADDISADADPSTGVSIYDTTRFQGQSGWFQVGGTSVACPVIAGCANASGGVQTSSQAQNTTFYSGIGTSAFHDVTSGSAGSFSALTGWDFPTGVGTPNGLSGF